LGIAHARGLRLGWEVWLDGMEDYPIHLFSAGRKCQADPITAEITYGLERIAMYLQQKESVYDLRWNEKVNLWGCAQERRMGTLHVQLSTGGCGDLLKMFDMCEHESLRMSEKGIVLPLMTLFSSAPHIFNVLDARGAISVAERTKYIERIRTLARLVAKNYLSRERRWRFPLLRKDNGK